MTQENFYPIWLAGLAALLALTATTWTLRSGTALSKAKSPGQSDLGPIGRAVAVLLPVALLAPAALSHADWTFTDYEIFTDFYLKGTAYPPPIFTKIGRFIPLGHQEWRLLYLWTDSIVAYHMLSLLQYAVFVAGCLTLLRLATAFSIPVFLFLITLSPVIISFGNIVLPERTQVMFFPWLLIMVLKWDRTAQVRYVMLAVLICHFMFYYKEPTVALVGVFAGLRLLDRVVRRVTARATPQDQVSGGIFAQSLLDLALILYGLGYLLAYLTTIPPAVLLSGEGYHGHTLDPGAIGANVSGWLARDPLLIVLLVLGLVCLLLRVARRRRLDSLDYLYLAGSTYAAALILTGLISKYYAALPMTALAIYLGWAPASWSRGPGKGPFRAVAGGALVALTVVNLAVATPSFFYRYDWTAMNRGLVDFLGTLPATPENRTIITEGPYSWDVFVLEAYANGHRNSGLCLPAFRGRPTSPCAGGSEDIPANQRLALKFYQGQHDRSARLYRGEQVIWSYDGEIFDAALDLTPRSLHPLLVPHYNIW